MKLSLKLTGLSFLFFSLSSSWGTMAPKPSSNMHPEQLKSYVESQVSSNFSALFNSGFSSVCKNYSSLSNSQKAEVLGVFVTGLAFAESGLDSFERFKESFGVWSIGLFQTSYEDATPYSCPYSRKADQGRSMANQSIYQTDNQVRCFINIASKLLKYPEQFPYLRSLASRKGYSSAARLSPTDKLSAYWSVFRSSNRQGGNRLYSFVASHRPSFCR